jgi:hypothetical protein
MVKRNLKRDSVSDYLQTQHHMIFPAEVEVKTAEENSVREILRPKGDGDALRASIDTSMFKGTRYSSIN